MFWKLAHCMLRFDFGFFICWCKSTGLDSWQVISMHSKLTRPVRNVSQIKQMRECFANLRMARSNFFVWKSIILKSMKTRKRLSSPLRFNFITKVTAWDLRLIFSPKLNLILYLMRNGKLETDLLSWSINSRELLSHISY